MLHGAEPSTFFSSAASCRSLRYLTRLLRAKPCNAHATWFTASFSGASELRTLKKGATLMNKERKATARLHTQI
eukprot:scaffold123532_cov21-Tisochrysis_lutea.AAC.3